MNVEGVEIVSTGTYPLASGETTFTAEDLAAAVLAASDPTVAAPRIKIGHSDPRFNEAVASGELDGEPAFGTVGNLRLSDDQQTVIGDYMNVPVWLGESLPSAYPGRSIEGGFNYTAPSGRDYNLVIDAVALLGVTLPGVTSLDDLQSVIAKNGSVPDPSEVKGQHIVARIERAGDPESQPTGELVGGMDLGSMNRAFCAALDEGEVPQAPDGSDVGPQLWWWTRSVRAEDGGSLALIVDDDEGHLLRIPFTVDGSEVAYGDPEVVVETFTPVAASGAGSGSRVIASWSANTAGRPRQEATMDIDPAVLRTRLGLADDADEAAISAALTAEPVEASKEEPAKPEVPAIPEGMVLVDREQFEDVKSKAVTGAEVAASIIDERRHTSIEKAQREGRIAAGKKTAETWAERYVSSPEETERLLTAKPEDGGLAPVIPVAARGEIGRSGDGESNESEDAIFAAVQARAFPELATATTEAA